MTTDLDSTDFNIHEIENIVKKAEIKIFPRCSWIRASQYNSYRKSNRIKQCIKFYFIFI